MSLPTWDIHRAQTPNLASTWDTQSQVWINIVRMIGEQCISFYLFLSLTIAITYTEILLNFIFFLWLILTMGWHQIKEKWGLRVPLLKQIKLSSPSDAWSSYPKTGLGVLQRSELSMKSLGLSLNLNWVKRFKTKSKASISGSWRRLKDLSPTPEGPTFLQQLWLQVDKMDLTMQEGPPSLLEQIDLHSNVQEMITCTMKTQGMEMNRMPRLDDELNDKLNFRCKPWIIVSKLPWQSSIGKWPLVSDPILWETQQQLMLFSQDPKMVINEIRITGDKPLFPVSEWENIVYGYHIDLDRVYSSVSTG